MNRPSIDVGAEHRGLGEPTIERERGPAPPSSARSIRAPRKPAKQSSSWALVAMIAFLGVGGYYAFRIAVSPTHYAEGGIFAMVAIALMTPVIKRMSNTEQEFDLGSIAFVGIALRLIGAVFRFNDASDGVIYFEEGVKLAPKFRSFQFVVDTGREIPGTGTIRYLSGLAQVITVDNMFATYIIWTMLSFVGCLLCYRAFVIAVPNGQRKRLAIILFCWPSMVFWPSSLGKEGVMLLAIGIATLGAAKYFTRQAGQGLLLFIAGVAAAGMVRPHVAIILIVAFTGATVTGSHGKGGRIRGGAKFAAALVLVISGAILSSKAADFFKVDNLGTETLSTVLGDTVDQTSQGGAKFTPALVQSPIDYPKAFVTVLFRPWVFEARQANDLMAAVEGMVLIGLLFASRRQLASLLRKAGRHYMSMYALYYLLTFVFAFSAIGNFGILARQRVQVLPLVMMLACLPIVTEGPPISERIARRRSREPSMTARAPR